MRLTTTLIAALLTAITSAQDLKKSNWIEKGRSDRITQTMALESGEFLVVKKTGTTYAFDFFNSDLEPIGSQELPKKIGDVKISFSHAVDFGGSAVALVSSYDSKKKHHNLYALQVSSGSIDETMNRVSSFAVRSAEQGVWLTKESDDGSLLMCYYLNGISASQVQRIMFSTVNSELQMVDSVAYLMGHTNDLFVNPDFAVTNSGDAYVTGLEFESTKAKKTKGLTDPGAVECNLYHFSPGGGDPNVAQVGVGSIISSVAMVATDDKVIVGGTYGAERIDLTTGIFLASYDQFYSQLSDVVMNDLERDFLEDLSESPIQNQNVKDAVDHGATDLHAEGIELMEDGRIALFIYEATHTRFELWNSAELENEAKEFYREGYLVVAKYTEDFEPSEFTVAPRDKAYNTDQREHDSFKECRFPYHSVYLVFEDKALTAFLFPDDETIIKRVVNRFEAPSDMPRIEQLYIDTRLVLYPVDEGSEYQLVKYIIDWPFKGIGE